VSLVCCKHVESKEIKLSTYQGPGDILDCNAAGHLKGKASISLVSVNSSKFPVLEDFLGNVNFLQVFRIKLGWKAWVAWSCGCVHRAMKSSAVNLLLQLLFLLQESLLLLAGVKRRHSSTDQRENRQRIGNRWYYTRSLMLCPYCLWENTYKESFCYSCSASLPLPFW